MNPVEFAEKGLLPDSLIRLGIRRRLALIRKVLESEDPLPRQRRKADFVVRLRQEPIALEQPRANVQHYELPPAFFGTFLGPWRKYSCCYWPDGAHTLDEAEERMLELTASRAGITSGQDILDLGCGWGSFSLWAAENYPTCRFHALSNSSRQIEFIRSKAAAKKLTNLTAERADAAAFDSKARYDRVVSIEMFEHIRNWGSLFEKIHRWLKPEGKLFLHFFCHHEMPYLYEDRDPSQWMGYYFFAGGMMPSRDLPRHFQDHLEVERDWTVNGRHYARTLEAWLRNMDKSKAGIAPILKQTYGPKWREWGNRWRIFLMACSELFDMGKGDEWLVAHYLLRK